jgi:CheY-like chemotaxis protein
VYVDRTRVRQVLINLLNNAARFTVKGGTTIRARADERNLVVEVEDTGIGIAAADIPKVFEEFRQLDGTMRRPHDGSGLGLAICQRFVELHGGTIWCESDVGAGTMFVFTLPVIDNVAGAALRPEWETWVRVGEPIEPPARPIVLVNRDPRIERMFQRYLEGYRVVSAGDEAEALRRCAETGAKGIVLVESPEVDAAERRRRLREVPRDAPIVLCSLPTSVSLGQRLGVSDYLIKPISGERLRETLARVARKARTVLVVDDDPDMVRLVARMLRSGARRYRVLRAYSGAEALDLLREQRPDAVILDLVMPGIDGYEVVRRMRASDDLAPIPVIAVSARSYETETVAAGGVEITREGGLSVGDLMACLRSALDALTTPGSAPPTEAASALGPAWGETPPRPGT